MTLQLTIKEPLPVDRKPTNKVIFHLRAMFGDADGYAENSFAFDPTDENARDLAYKVIRLVEAYGAEDWNTQCDIACDRTWEKLHEEAFGEPVDSRVIDRISDLCGHDMMYDQMGAPDRWHLTYFDDKGIEHRVELTVDGKPFKGRRA